MYIIYITTDNIYYYVDVFTWSSELNKNSVMFKTNDLFMIINLWKREVVIHIYNMWYII